MPPANHVILASGAAVAVSVAIASAIALYESPELRRYADDLRRRIAIAMHSMGDSINPPAREPLFNRPEDAHGFLQSGNAPGVDADEETKRRQREELMYWNSVRLAKEAEESEKAGQDGAQVERKGTFDDFLRPDAQGEKGSYVYRSGVDAKNENETDGLRKRGMGALYANPFADEHGISSEELDGNAEKHVVPNKDEGMSDIYSATDRPDEPSTPTAEAAQPSLIDIDEEPSKTPTTASSETMDREREIERELDFQIAGQENPDEAYASIQAWAQNSSAPGFYSPLPSTPAVPQSEPELVSDGQVTPTDSMSLAGSGEDVAEEARSTDERPFDVMSESDGMLTPASWSEVGSVISESDAPIPAQAPAQ